MRSIPMKKLIGAVVAALAAGLPAQAQGREPACIEAPAIDPAVAAQLPAVAARTAEWAQARAKATLEAGRPASASQVALARSVGVKHPERIRVLLVDEIALPVDPLLTLPGAKTGLARVAATGLTIGYAVMILRSEAADPALWRHELRHVAQYEACGGIKPFLASYLPHLLTSGYERSPFEEDARAHE